MLDITPICKAYSKKASHFTDNNGIREQCEITRGRNANTRIPGSLVPDFLLWLSPETRRLLLTEGVDAALKLARSK